MSKSGRRQIPRAMNYSGFYRQLPLAIAVAALASMAVRADRRDGGRVDGFNVVAVAHHPFGSETAKVSIAEAKSLGARAISIILFLSQPTPVSPNLTRGPDMPDAELRAAIRNAHELNLTVLVKPQVFVPKSWAGAIAMTSEDDWQQWFANYRNELDRIAHIAAEEKADALVIGTELSATEQRPEWNIVIDAARAVFPGRLLYMAHGVEEAESVPFWGRLDAIGVTLYPRLGPDADRNGRRAEMHVIADRLEALAVRSGKPIVVGEIGLRSATGAAAKPWESAEERPSLPDPALQADVIADWLAELDRPSIEGVMIWEWLTNPDAGGLNDTDFTVQGKPAERVLLCAWTEQCATDWAIVRLP